MECDYLYCWIKKTVTYAEISPRLVNPRDIAGNTEKEGEELAMVKDFTYWDKYVCSIWLEWTLPDPDHKTTYSLSWKQLQRLNFSANEIQFGEMKYGELAWHNDPVHGVCVWTLWLLIILLKWCLCMQALQLLIILLKLSRCV